MVLGAVALVAVKIRLAPWRKHAKSEVGHGRGAMVPQCPERGGLFRRSVCFRVPMVSCCCVL